MSENLLAHITPVILTWNEEANIGRTLAKLDWAREVVVVDSGSTDTTLAICAGYANVRVVMHAFDCHSNQWNFAVHDTGISTDWVLALDADYLLTQALVDEIAALQPAVATSGYRMGFRYCVEGHQLSGTLYPPVITLYRRQLGRYVQDGHTQRLQIAGTITELQHKAQHDDRKPLSRWLQSQLRYAELECGHLESLSWQQLRWPDRLRSLIVITPWLIPLYCLTFGKGFRDGRPGLYYALQRGIAESILSLALLKHKFTGAKP